MALLNSKISPEKIKNLDQEQLLELAQEIRNIIIKTISINGGHLASSLGVVEITLALHKVFNMPEDKIIWDVGHQCYPHKLLTGRLGRFHTIRQFGGISGFPKSLESQFDCFDTGHSGTSISSALGMAVQRDLMALSHKVIAVIGDASLTNGMALEAMNNAGYMGTDIIVVLNDNEKSISKNVGAYSKYLSKLRMELVCSYTKRKGKRGMFHNVYTEEYRRASDGMLVQFKERIKHALAPSRTGAVFQEIGFKYFGPINGHDVQSLCEVFESVKGLKCPILIHTVTRKGKGYKFAEEDSTKFHGIGSFDYTNGKVEKKTKIASYTSVYGNTIVDLAREDEKIIAITAAMKDGTGLIKFEKEFPSRFFDVGIAEEHAVTFAAGLAKDGAKPIVTIYSTFLQRGYDQIVHDVCLQNLPVTFVLDRGGIVGEDGPTHNGVFDFAYLRHIPNIVLMAPKDENELRNMLKTAVDFKGPIAIRFPRGVGIGVKMDSQLRNLPIGKSEFLREGDDVAILAIGSMVYPSLKAAEILAKSGIQSTVVNSRFIKPLDKALIFNLASKVNIFITVEEHALACGFGSALLELLADDSDVGDLKVTRLGLPDTFIEQGARSTLLKKFGLTDESIATVAKNLVNKERRSKVAQDSRGMVTHGY